MVKALWGLLFLPLIGLSQSGSFPPQAGIIGSDAMHADSSVFRDWAVTCEVERGFRRINFPDSGVALTGEASFALGKADANGVVSLGDSGVATLTFTEPFFDGPGPDFAVFENGFKSSGQAFLELAFVEVSSNGVDFIRFPAISEVQTDTQIGFANVMDASYLHNLAGKYISRHGVPFDLAELPDTSVLNKNAVTHVRVVDVIGSIDPNIGSYDSQGTLINDPWPTTFEQCGFDLDAIGIINSPLPPLSIQDPWIVNAHVHYNWFDLMGTPIDPENGSLPSGIYLRCSSVNAYDCEKVFIP